MYRPKTNENHETKIFNEHSKSIVYVFHDWNLKFEIFERNEFFTSKTTTQHLVSVKIKSRLQSFSVIQPNKNDRNFLFCWMLNDEEYGRGREILEEKITILFFLSCFLVVVWSVFLLLIFFFLHLFLCCCVSLWFFLFLA